MASARDDLEVMSACKILDGGLRNSLGQRQLTETTSTPLAAKAWAAGLEESRVMPLIVNSFERTESARTASITEPPWLPVAPKTVMSLDILDGWYGEKSKINSWGVKEKVMSLHIHSPLV